MKRLNLKRIISMISAVAILIMMLPMGIITLADGEPDAPELISYAGEILYSDTQMKSCTVGTDYSTLRFNGILPAEAYNKDEEILIVHRVVYDYIEFDVYIEDYDAFIHSLSYDASGNPLNKRNTLMFNLSSREDFDLGKQSYQWKRLETQISKDGWNHIILNLYNNSGATTMQPVTSSPTGSADNRFYSLFIGEENGEMWATNNSIPQSVNDVSHTTTETAGSVFAFTNVSLTAVSVPDTDFSEYGMISKMGNDITEQNITPDSKEENRYVTYSEINENTKLTEKFESDINCTVGEYIEFDFFCENPKVLKDTFNYDKVDYLFTLTDKNGKTASSNFLDKIAQGGWSHIRLGLASFKGDDVDFSAISSYALMFDGKDLSKKFAERKQEISVANMHLTGINGIRYKLIENKTEIPLFTDIKSSSLGKNFGALLSDSEKSFTVTGIEPADLSAADYIAFDLHISDTDKYNSLTGSNKIYLWLSSAGGKSTESVSVQFDKYRQVGDNNWLHFFIPKADFTVQAGKINWASVNSCGIGFENPESSAGDVFDLEMGFTNVGGYAVGDPQGDLLGQITAVLSTDTHRIVADDDGFKYDISGFEPAKFASGNTFEMDVFVENAEKLNKAVAAGASLNVILTNESDQTMKLELLTLLSHDGWNHISLNRDLGIYDSFQSKRLVTAVSVVLNDEQNEVSLNNMTLVFSNLYFTYLTEREEGVFRGEKICDFITKPNSGYLNQSFSSAITGKSSEVVDFTDIMFVEFDFYCQDYVLIDSAIKVKNNSICLTLTDDAKVTYKADIWSFVYKSGWNHISLPYGNFIASRQGGTQNMKSYILSFSGDLSNQNSAKNASWAIANVCTSGLLAPEFNTENAVVQTMLSKLKIGTLGNKLTFGFDQKLEESVSLEDARLIEFDFFVEDQKTYREQFALDEYGTYSERYVEFSLISDDGRAYWNNWSWQVKHDGWNRIKLPVYCPDSKSNWEEGKKSVASFSFSCGGKALAESSLADDLIMVANVTATKLIIPEKPKNSIQTFGTYIEGTCGDYFHFLQDRAREYKLDETDLSKGSSIEFDIYINGYEELMAAEAGTWRNERLCLMLSSTYRSLWESFGHQPHLKFCSFAVFDKQITHDGWNHIKLGFPEFEQYTRGQNYDSSKTTAWSITFTDTTNVHTEANPAGYAYIFATNITSCGYYVDIPDDEKAASKPDKSSVYISSCDFESDDYGAWNNAVINTKNKSEGDASVGMDVTYLTEIYTVKPTYIFDDTVDFSDLSELKFDVFTNFPQFLGKQGNKAEVLLASDKTGKNDYYTWNLDFSQITKTGWNSVSLNIKGAKRVGNPDIKNIKAIIFRYNEINLDKEFFEAFKFYLDNLRYKSSTGNTVLKINLTDDEDIISDDYNDFYDDGFEDYADDASMPDDLIDIGGEASQKVVSIVKRIISTDYLKAGIIIGAETLTALAVTFLIILIIRKKKKIADEK